MPDEFSMVMISGAYDSKRSKRGLRSSGESSLLKLDRWVVPNTIICVGGTVRAGSTPLKFIESLLPQDANVIVIAKVPNIYFIIQPPILVKAVPSMFNCFGVLSSWHLGSCLDIEKFNLT